jgi:hypothetical protein
MNKQQKPTLDQNDYLWDRTGNPDPEIRRLESTLGKFRLTRVDPPAFPGIVPAQGHSSWWHAIAVIPWAPRFAAAAVLFITVISGVLLSRFDSSSSTARDGWEVEWTTAAAADASVKEGLTKKSVLQVGASFETDSASTASISVADVGRLDVEPGTRLRLLQSFMGRKHIALDRGTIHAAIWAPPGEFVVDTPSAIAVDLGCMYTLQVDDSGSGLLHTTLGWVGFRSHGRESFIPAGAAAATRVQSGPGTPYFENASEAFRAAVSQFDGSGESSVRHIALQVVLREARPQDSLTLWHLLSRVNDDDRPAVFDRLAALVSPPNGVTREGILRLDGSMLDAWWNALDLGDISLWRHWERSWTGR